MGNAMTLLGTELTIAPNEAAEMVQGIGVTRAAATLPQGTASALFTVAGGLVKVTSIVGYVTVAVGAVANNTKLVFDPTAVGANVDLCAVNDTNADVVGTIYTITGTAANAMVAGLSVLAQMTPLILQPGSILLDCVGSTTGSIRWRLHYVPIDEGATVAAA